MTVRIPISPEVWQMQWEPAVHQLSRNIWDFEVELAKNAVRIFKHSFDIRRFYSNGSTPWRLTGKTNKGGNPVGSLTESYSLRNSIKWVSLKSMPGTTAVRVYTDPNAFGGTYRHKGFCFAAIHNDGIGRFPQRQFMPTGNNDSTEMDKAREKYEQIIFRTLPGKRIR